MAALPPWELSVKGVWLLGLLGPWKNKSYGPIRVIFQASCSWSLCRRLVEAYRRPLWPVFLCSSTHWGTWRAPLPGSFSAVWHVRPRERPPWLGSYSIDRCISHLKRRLGGVLLCSAVHQLFDVPASLLFSCRCWRVGSEKLWWWLHPLRVTQQYGLLPWLPGFPPQKFSTTVSSLTSPRSTSLQSTAAFALGWLHNP